MRRVEEKVEPRNTSRTCTMCGFIKENLALAHRLFICPKCGWFIDRKYNASLNILRAGSGLPLEPVDRKPRKISFRGEDAQFVRTGWFTIENKLG